MSKVFHLVRLVEPGECTQCSEAIKAGATVIEFDDEILCEDCDEVLREKAEAFV